MRSPGVKRCIMVGQESPPPFIKATWMIVALLLYTQNFVVGSEDNKQQPPNIVFILADDLGWDDVGFHGSKQIPTPNMDALAYDGVIMGNYYTQPICTPSRAALLTGRHPIHTGMQHFVLMSAMKYGLGLEEKLLPEFLKEVGYSTHMVGKWHLGFFAKEYTPMYRGFDSHYGYLGGVEDYWDHTMQGGGHGSWGLDFWNNEEVEKSQYGQYSTHVFTKETERVIEEHDTSKPLFLYLPHQAPHNANSYKMIEAPYRYKQKFNFIKNEGRKTYAAMVSVLDESIGNVTKALHKKGILNNTVIMFSTDNGGPAHGVNGNHASNIPLRGMKMTLWEGGTRGVGFVWSPLLKKSGYVSNHMTQIMDWLPTILRVSGYDMTKLPANIDGMDMWDALCNNTKSPRYEMLYNIDPKGASAYRLNDKKLIHSADKAMKERDGWFPPEQVTLKGDELWQYPSDEEAMGDPEQYDYYRLQALSMDDVKPLYNNIAYSNKKGVEETAPAELFKSDLPQILQELGRPLLKPKPYLIQCGPIPANKTSCQPWISPCLFDLSKDPCEYHNLAEKEPGVLRDLTLRLMQYNATAVPTRNKGIDPKGFPIHHNGIWRPWVNLTDGLA